MCRIKDLFWKIIGQWLVKFKGFRTFCYYLATIAIQIRHNQDFSSCFGQTNFVKQHDPTNGHSVLCGLQFYWLWLPLSIKLLPYAWASKLCLSEILTGREKIKTDLTKEYVCPRNSPKVIPLVWSILISAQRACTCNVVLVAILSMLRISWCLFWLHIELDCCTVSAINILNCLVSLFVSH